MTEKWWLRMEKIIRLHTMTKIKKFSPNQGTIPERWTGWLRVYKEIFGAILGSIQIAQPVREQLFGRTTVCTNSCSREQLFTQKVVTRSYDSTECESSSSHHRKHGWFRSLQLETNNTPPKTNGLCTTFES